MAREAGNPNVSLAIGSGSNVFGLTTLGDSYASNGSSSTFSFSQATFVVDITSFDSQPLSIGLLNPVATGLNGSFSLHLSILKGTTVIESDQFTDKNAAISFFTDHVLTFGPINSGVSGANATLSFELDLTSNAIGDSFRADFLAAAVPEPGINILLGLGGLALLTRSRWFGRRLSILVANKEQRL
jgi:hypothetical protein